MKLAQLCQLFVSESSLCALTAEEQKEVIAYAKERLPVFLKQVHRILSAVRGATTPMKLYVRQELAAHFVPEVLYSSTVYNIGTLLELAMFLHSGGASDLPYDRAGQRSEKPSGVGARV